MEWILGILASVLGTLMVTSLLYLVKKLNTFAKEQRASNERTRRFERSMQRAEINRYFRIVVEQGNPISPEELSHLESCYKAYHEDGGNGVGTLMWERIYEHVKLVTTVDEKEVHEHERED